jgi:hypothetical protein
MVVFLFTVVHDLSVMNLHYSSQENNSLHSTLNSLILHKRLYCCIWGLVNYFCGFAILLFVRWTLMQKRSMFQCWSHGEITWGETMYTLLYHLL